MLTLAQHAKHAARRLARADTATKNAALHAMAEGLTAAQADILAANARDVEAAHANGLSAALIDRLTLTPARLAGIAADVRSVAALPDPVGATSPTQTLPNGLRLHQQRVPLGVLLVIYESRPNVTLDTAALALKAGNAVILRGGKETQHSNRALVAVIQAALTAHGLPAASAQMVDDPDRARVLELLQMSDLIDMVIPRGGAGLHAFCREHSRIPVMTGGIGICHLFVDDSADQARALPVIFNAKTQRPSVCNALDTLLVHRAIADTFLPQVIETLRPAGVTFRAHPSTFHSLGKKFTGAYLQRNPETGTERVRYAANAGWHLPEGVTEAGPDDFDTEWLALILGLKVVADLDEALAHIAAHSTGHSDGILTATPAHAERFIREVDSAAVYVNASTRFTDGGQFGLGAEVAVSTQRLHARGPMGLLELTTYKWVGVGDYLIRA